MPLQLISVSLPIASLLQPNFVLCADYSKGFGGKFGVQSDRQDKCAAGWDHVEKVEKHESQKGEGEGQREDGRGTLMDNRV